MASLRDVLDHAGKRVRIIDDAGAGREGLAIRRGDVALVDAKLTPRAGERLVFLESNEAFRIEGSEPQLVREKLDHFRVRLGAVPRG